MRRGRSSCLELMAGNRAHVGPGSSSATQQDRQACAEPNADIVPPNSSFPVAIDLVPNTLVRPKLSVLCLSPKLSVSGKSDLSLICHTAG